MVMFAPGKVYKVKVQIHPGEIGFGHATILQKSHNSLTFNVSTSKEANCKLPKGTRIWFVNDAPATNFNGVWASSIVSTELVKGKPALVCDSPKFEALTQRRRAPRAPLAVPVRMLSDSGEKLAEDVWSCDISRSGIAVETKQNLIKEIEIGSKVKLIIEANIGEIDLAARMIRVQENWLSKKTKMGLEFIEPGKEAGALLDKLLALLGTQLQDTSDVDCESQSPTERKQSQPAKSQTGLSGWMQPDTSGNTKKSPFVGGGKDKKDSKPTVNDKPEPENG